jgi:hypothetical protein
MMLFRLDSNPVGEQKRLRDRQAGCKYLFNSIIAGKPVN